MTSPAGKSAMEFSDSANPKKTLNFYGVCADNRFEQQLVKATYVPHGPGGFHPRRTCRAPAANARPAVPARPRRPATRHRQSWLLIVLLGCGGLSLPLAALGLNPANSVSQYNCQNWTRQNGLPADRVAAVIQTKDGYIWLGTQNGLIRFDGREFVGYKLDLAQALGQNVQKLSRAKAGGMWFAVYEGGFGAFDGQKFSPIPDDRLCQPGISATTILETQDGAVWTGADRGLGCWAPGKPMASFLDKTNGTPLALCEGHNGRVWVATVDHGLACWTNGNAVAFPDPSLSQRVIRALVEDADNHIWVGTDTGLRCYDLKGQPIEIPAVDSEIQALLLDRHGTLWIGTTAMGLARCRDGQITYFRKTDGLGSDVVTSLCEDAEGSLWIGTSEGLSQLTEVRFPIYSKAEGLIDGPSLSVSASVKGGLWITASTSFCYFDGRRARYYTNNPNLAYRYIKLGFEARNGDFYMVDGNRNINVLSGEILTTISSGNVWPTAFAEDDESVLAAVGPILYRCHNGKLLAFEYKDAAPDYYWINCLCVAKDGTIWVASNGGGIYSLKGGQAQHLSPANGLSSDRVQCFCEDVDGSMWAGMNTGLARIKNGLVKNIRAENGLVDERIFAMVPDDVGFFWICTGQGIVRVAHRSLQAFADGQSNSITCELFDGLESIKSIARNEQECSGCKTLDGRIWFPNTLGVVMIDPTNFFTNRVAPPVCIQQIQVNGITLQDRLTPALQAGKGELEFRFAPLTYIAPKKARVRYRLEGQDPTWIEAGERRQVSYNRLRPGPYTFRVQACNDDGVWNTTGDSFSVEFPPFFYQKLWFEVLCGFGVVLALFGAYRWKVRHMLLRQQKLLAQNDLLEAKVARRTSELAHANSSLRQEIVERENLHVQLVDASRRAGMAEVATEVLHNVGNVLNSVNVSASIMTDTLRRSKSSDLSRVVPLLRDPDSSLGRLLATDEKGRLLPSYIERLAERIQAENSQLLKEMTSLASNLDHIKEIVARQQSNAGLSGIKEVIPAVDLVEEAIRINADAFARHEIALTRNFENVPPVLVDRHKVLQILINVLSNALHACVESGRPARKVKVWIQAPSQTRLQIGVEDNGVGIDPANLTRIFEHGFTTRADGHGFGLHSGALAAKELEGSLTARSDGPGQGASFILELPAQSQSGGHT
jgi:ligand-binding sensor domain-containing protein/signal transduction histidine kinase